MQSLDHSNTDTESHLSLDSRHWSHGALEHLKNLLCPRQLMTELEAEDSPATEQMAHPPHLSHSALSHMQQALAGRRADLVKHWLAVHTTFQKRKNDVVKIESKSSKNCHRYALLTALI